MAFRSSSSCAVDTPSTRTLNRARHNYPPAAEETKSGRLIAGPPPNNFPRLPPGRIREREHHCLGSGPGGGDFPAAEEEDEKVSSAKEGKRWGDRG